jgi:hypothetical protein
LLFYFKCTENLYYDTNLINQIHSQYEKCSLSAEKLTSQILENTDKYDILEQTETISMFPVLSNLKYLAATENTLYYSDDKHLTIQGNQLILPEIIKIINN